MYWAIRDGDSISVWNDNWVWLDVKLKEVASAIPPFLSEFRVCDLVDTSGHWNVSPLLDLIPEEYFDRIHALFLPNSTNGAYVGLWPRTPDGNYSIASAYSLIASQFESLEHGVWRAVWNITTSERVRSFLWLCSSVMVCAVIVPWLWSILCMCSKTSSLPCRCGWGW